MRVLVIGNGGREHAVVNKLKKDGINDIYCIKGNAGTSKIATNIDIDQCDIKSIINFVKKNDIDITIVGPELPLAMGIVDEFEKENLKIFGPNKACAKLEYSN